MSTKTYDSIHTLPLFNFDRYLANKDLNWFLVDYDGRQKREETDQLKKVESEIMEEYYWGRVDESEGNIGEENITSADNLPVFDIVLTYGNYNLGPRNRDSISRHTLKVLKDVELIGQSQMINVNGQPIQEVYNFICRRIDVPITALNTAKAKEEWETDLAAQGRIKREDIELPIDPQPLGTVDGRLNPAGYKPPFNKDLMPYTDSDYFPENWDERRY